MLNKKTSAYQQKFAVLFTVLFTVPASQLILVEDSYASPNFLTTWETKYSQSSSGDMGCQLCHTDESGGSPWNAYGAAIKQVYRQNGFIFDEALDLVENINSDNDPSGTNNIDEINLNRQPGWTEGGNNSSFTFNGSNSTETTGIQAPLPKPTTFIDPAQPLGVNPLPSIRRGSIAIALETVADGFTSPVYAAPAAGINDVLFVIEQTGKIWQVELNTGNKTVFHDVGATGLNQLISLSSNYDERGLLGLSFHPNYLNNGLFYTYQSEAINANDTVDFSTMPNATVGDHQSVISQWTVTNPQDNPVVSSVRKVLMRIEQPQSNHNGGALNFDSDGLLYISLGDGGGQNDQGRGHGFFGNARDKTNPLGSILRIDPLSSNHGQYGIPADNPFVGQPGLDEIFAYGFRNVSRFSFDSQTGDLYAGDVGQNQIEEIDIVIKGGNYGWNWKEGSFFFYADYISNDAPPSLPNDLIDPVAEYDHDDGKSITGGYVYRGQSIDGLQARYVFADWAQNFSSPQGRLFYLDATNTIKEFQMNRDAGLYINGIAQDNNNELYVIGVTEIGTTGTTGVLKKIIQGEVDDSFCVPIKAKNQSVAMICL